LSLLVVFDVDSTLIQQEVIELIADQAGVLPEVKRVTDLAMGGEMDFETSLAQRVSLLAGLDVASVSRVQDLITVTPGVLELISAVHSNGGKVAAVSGGFSLLLEPLARRLNLDFWKANELEIAEGKLTGRTIGEVIGRKSKADYLKIWADEAGIDLSKTVAIGDGANDIDMLQAAGTAIAFQPKPVLREYADFVIEENSMLPVIEKLQLSSS
jgi:phosphoserine phosphatase